jgi:hypothetical protein
MITDHYLILSGLFGVGIFLIGYNVGVWASVIQVRRLRQANETLRIMLNGVPYDDKPPMPTSKGVEIAERKARAWWVRRPKKPEMKWNYVPRHASKL